MSTSSKILIVAACMFVPLAAMAEERDLVYTYIGPVASTGANRISYTDWFGLTTQTKKISGYHISCGVSLWVVAKWLIGDFSVQYIYNQNEKQLHHLYFTMAGRIGVKMGSVGTFAPGVGFYFDTPPSNRKYRGGGGLRAPIGFLFNTTFDSRFFVEGNVMYGSYGMGEKSTKLSFGGSLGMIFKVGRI
jgi:hypothetical protein